MYICAATRACVCVFVQVTNFLFRNSCHTGYSDYSSAGTISFVGSDSKVLFPTPVSRHHAEEQRGACCCRRNLWLFGDSNPARLLKSLQCSPVGPSPGPEVIPLYSPKVTGLCAVYSALIIGLSDSEFKLVVFLCLEELHLRDISSIALLREHLPGHFFSIMRDLL